MRPLESDSERAVMSLIYDREALQHKMHGMSEIPSWPGSKGFFLNMTKKKWNHTSNTHTR